MITAPFTIILPTLIKQDIYLYFNISTISNIHTLWVYMFKKS